MRIVALEEHFSLPMIHGQTGGAGPKLTVANDENMPAVVRNVAAKIVDLGESRIADDWRPPRKRPTRPANWLWPKHQRT